MAKRFYIVPRVGTGTSGDGFRPKYFEALPDPWSAMNFGKEPWFMVVCDTAAHAAITANPDVIVLPQDIDAQIGANRDAVVAALESLNVPSGWVTTAMTYRFVLKCVAAMFQFAQRLHGHANLRIYDTGITMATRFNQLPASVRTKLIETAQTMNFDTSSLSGGSTIRQILKAMADQWGDRPIHIGGLTL